MAERVFRYRREAASGVVRINAKLDPTTPVTFIASSGGHVVDYKVEEGSVGDLDNCLAREGFVRITDDPTDNPANELDLPPVSTASLFESSDVGTPISLVKDVFSKWVSSAKDLDTGVNLALADDVNNKVVIGAEGAGRYQLSVHMSAEINNSSLTALAVFLNGTLVESIRTADQKSNNQRLDLSCSGPLDLVSGDFVELFVMMDTGASPVITVHRVNFNVTRIGGGSGIGGGHTVQDEGSSLTARAKLNFIGAGVTATDNPGNGATDVTIPGGGGSGSALAAATAERSSTFGLSNAYQDVTWNATQFENDTSIVEHDDTNTQRITVKATTTYKVVVNLLINWSGTIPDVQLKLQKNGVDISGTEHVITNSAGQVARESYELTIDLAANDYLTVQAKHVDIAAVSDIKATSTFSVVRYEGIQGATGTAGADGDITWENAWVSQNYTANQAVEYQGSAYVCHTNTTANQVPTDTAFWDLMASKGDVGPAGAGILVQSVQAAIAVDTTETSPTFVSLMTRAITISAGNRLNIYFTAGVSNSSNNRTNRFRVLVDGSPKAGTGFIGGVGTPEGISIAAQVSGLAAGARTVEVEWKTTGGMVQIRPVTVPDAEHATLLVNEVL